jgi:hypothetical protein
MHPELLAEACRRLDVLCRLEIPMVRSPASYALAPHFWRAWIDFLFSYKRRSPLLLHYMQEGGKEPRQDTTSTHSASIENFP